MSTSRVLSEHRPSLNPSGNGHGAVAVSSAVNLRGSSFLRYLLVGLDAAALAVAWGIAIALVPPTPSSALRSVLWTTVLVVSGLALIGALGLYRARVCNLRTVEYARLARGSGLLALAAVAVAGIAGFTMPPGEVVLGAPLTFLLTIIVRSGYRTWLTDRRRAGRYVRSVLLVGTGDEAAEIAALLSDHADLGYRAAGVIGSQSGAAAHGLADEWRGELDDGAAVLAETGASGAIVCASDLSGSQLNQIVQDLLDAGVHVQLSSGLHGVAVGRLRPAPLAHEPLFYVEPVSLAWWQLAMKRTIDYVLSAVILIVAAPLLALAAIGIKLSDRGPVLFKQQRVGRDGEPFVLHKLRTMRVGAELETDSLLELNAREGPLVKLPHDPRVTKFGRILRATSIDELPQLWNVFNGTMSLVGPRPALPDEVADFDAELRARESVRPGITGLWQVEGRDNPSFAAYRRFDLFYLQNWSVALDLLILLSTVESVIARAFRGLSHLDQEIQVAPPEVPDPGRAAARMRKRQKRQARSARATVNKEVAGAG